MPVRLPYAFAIVQAGPPYPCGGPLYVDGGLCPFQSRRAVVHLVFGEDKAMSHRRQDGMKRDTT